MQFILYELYRGGVIVMSNSSIVTNVHKKIETEMLQKKAYELIRLAGRSDLYVATMQYGHIVVSYAS